MRPTRWPAPAIWCFSPVTGVSVDYTHVATLAMINLIINSLARKNPEKVRSHLSQEVDNCSARELFCL